MNCLDTSMNGLIRCSDTKAMICSAVRGSATIVIPSKIRTLKFKDVIREDTPGLLRTSCTNSPNIRTAQSSAECLAAISFLKSINCVGQELPGHSECIGFRDLPDSD